LSSVVVFIRLLQFSVVQCFAVVVTAIFVVVAQPALSMERSLSGFIGTLWFYPQRKQQTWQKNM